MRKSVVALLLLAGAAATLANTAVAHEELGLDVGSKLVNAQMQREMRSAAARTGTSAVGDTTYVGFVPGKVTATNYWGVGKGTFKVYSTNVADYGYWGWDNDGVHNNIAEVHGDSLFGWWPIRSIENGTGGLTLSDDNRPWWAVDIGNQVNYVINQGTAHKRSFGVVGVWHRDNGSTSGGGVTWSALGGSNSLWCGLRRDGDNAFSDPITGNPFNARTLAYMSSSLAGGTTGGGIATNHKFPGYASQWDQMAYRDINMGASTSLTVRFRFRTNMSTGRGTAAATQTGWFDKDPLPVTPGGAANGNFISSSASGTNAPIDSFMVYVGAPVNDAATLYSDAVTRSVYDPQRRWFDEVIRANEAGKYKEILSVAGDNAAQQVTLGPVSTTAFGSKVRLVFRSKTNRGFDDEGGSVAGAYSSGGAGAVVIDDVEIDSGAGFTTLGDFEASGAVDNSTGTDPLSAWKTTGKPPAIYHHVHDATQLIYEDLCGPVGGALRICNLTGNVISAGDHDNSEAAGGLVAGQADRERFDGMISPTVNLRSGGGTNEMGINAAIATATEDYYIEYDIYTGIFDITASGNEWRGGLSAYPGKQSDGIKCWSDWNLWPFVLFNPDKQCFQDQEPGFTYGLLKWSAADAEGGAVYPDSVRMLLQKRQECFRFGVTSGCSPTDGCYWDNVSLAFIDGAAPPMSVNIWDWVNDTFTVNGLNRNGVAPGSANFDTTTALVKVGLNIAQTSGNTLRYDVPGDTTAVSAQGNNVRLDLVFRVDPGPGNYTTVGNKTTSLRRVPTSTTAANIAGPTGTNFWEEYLLSNGAKGSAGGHPAGAVNGGKRWSSLVWNSARCDSAEINLYTISVRGIGVPASGAFATMYEETDPKYTKLGLVKNRCFLTTATAANTQANTVCDISLTDGWPVSAGYVAENGLALGKTYEYTKILPDGQFTPGTHVEYFLRREDSPSGDVNLCPDTLTVFPQPSEGSTDAHRWQEFSVLPDTWKKGAYGGLGPACMLYVDLNDRRGNERVWVSIADSIGATAAAKYGSHNGWHAAGGADVNSAAGFVVNKNAQPGTTWDMFGEKASESINTKGGTIGSDLSNHASSFQIDNKWSFQGPSLGMLEAYYSVILLLSGDLNSGILGPFNDLGNNDTKMLQDFLLGGTSGSHRGLFIEGDGFVEDQDGTTLLNNFLYVSLRDPSYLLLSGNTAGCIDLVTQTPITTNGDIYGIRNGCLFTDDVLDAGTRSVPASLYAPAGNAPPPVVASVFHDVDAVNGEFWQSLVDGWDVENLRSRFCDGSYGRLAYYYNALTNIFGKICAIAGTPPITTDVPSNQSGQVFVDFMNLRNNPLVSGQATVNFGLSKADHVQVRVFDVSGRLVRTLADRQFAPKAGGWTLTWDGTDDTGHQVARGVYFTQVKYINSRFTDAKKLTVLK